MISSTVARERENGSGCWLRLRVATGRHCTRFARPGQAEKSACRAGAPSANVGSPPRRGRGCARSRRACVARPLGRAGAGKKGKFRHCGVLPILPEKGRGGLTDGRDYSRWQASSRAEISSSESSGKRERFLAASLPPFWRTSRRKRFACFSGMSTMSRILARARS